MQALNNWNEERYGMFTSGDLSKPRHYLNRYCSCKCNIELGQ